MTGTLPDSIGNLTGLTLLHLDNNDFSGDIPESIGNLTKLSSSLSTYLYGGNAFTNLPAGIGNITGQTNFSLGNYPSLSGETIPDEWMNLTNLTYLAFTSI